jgi:hypothetical protein
MPGCRSTSPATDARLVSLGPTSFELTADAPGDYVVRVHHSRYWDVLSGDACVAREGDWTLIRARAAGLIRVGTPSGPGALLEASDAC